MTQTVRGLDRGWRGMARDVLGEVGEVEVQEAANAWKLGPALAPLVPLSLMVKFNRPREEPSSGFRYKKEPCDISRKIFCPI
jgi:hypothetical protein